MARRITVQLRRSGLSLQFVVTTVLVLLVAAAGVGLVEARDWVPPSVLLLILLAAAFLLQFVGTVIVCASVALEIAYLEVSGWVELGPGVLLVQGLALVTVLGFVRSREKIGLSGAAGTFMLVDLRDRLEAHGRIPRLPRGWRVDRALRSAYAEAFSGDFVVAARAERGGLLEIVLVDVSGKGQAAGVRSLLLSGAFGGLLGAMPRVEGTDFIFPSSRGAALSDMALLSVMRRMGSPYVPHGLRSTFRDWAAERTEFPRDLAEKALAHALDSKTEAAYRRGDMVERRAAMMAAWAEFLTTPTSVAVEAA